MATGPIQTKIGMTMKKPTTPSAVELLAKHQLAKIEKRKAFWKGFAEGGSFALLLATIIGLCFGIGAWIAWQINLESRLTALQKHASDFDLGFHMLEMREMSADESAERVHDSLSARIKALEDAKPKPDLTVPYVPAPGVYITNLLYWGTNSFLKGFGTNSIQVW